MDDVRYPIGEFVWEPDLAPERQRELILNLGRTPEALRHSLRGLAKEQFNLPYRENGWTVRQIIHHLADSAMLGFALYKYGLTEECPRLKHYDCAAWGNLEHATTATPEASLNLIDALYRRWVALLDMMDDRMLARDVDHEYLGKNSLGNLLQVYEWHGRHHIAQIEAFRERMG